MCTCSVFILHVTTSKTFAQKFYKIFKRIAHGLKTGSGCIHLKIKQLRNVSVGACEI